MDAFVDRDVLAGREFVEPREFRYRCVDARHARGVGQRPHRRFVDGAIDVRAGLRVAGGVQLEVAGGINVARREVGDAFLVDVIVEPVVGHATTLPVAALLLR